MYLSLFMCIPACTLWCARSSTAQRPPDDGPICTSKPEASLKGPHYKHCRELTSPCHCLYSFISNSVWVILSHVYSSLSFVAILCDLTKGPSECCLQFTHSLDFPFRNSSFVGHLAEVLDYFQTCQCPLCLALMTLSCLFLKNTMWIYTGAGRKSSLCQL